MDTNKAEYDYINHCIDCLKELIAGTGGAMVIGYIPAAKYKIENSARIEKSGNGKWVIDIIRAMIVSGYRIGLPGVKSKLPIAADQVAFLVDEIKKIYGEVGQHNDIAKKMPPFACSYYDHKDGRATGVYCGTSGAVSIDETISVLESLIADLKTRKL
jgi:hypothetical protein